MTGRPIDALEVVVPKAWSPQQLPGARAALKSEIPGLLFRGANTISHGIVGVMISGLLASSVLLGRRFAGQVLSGR